MQRGTDKKIIPSFSLSMSEGIKVTLIIVSGEEIVHHAYHELVCFLNRLKTNLQ